MKNKRLYNIFIDTRDIYVNYWDGDFFSGFNIVIYYMAIDSHYTKDDEGKYVLDKMNSAFPDDFMNYSQLEKYILEYERYRKMQKPLVIIDEEFILIEGTYRVALSLYHNDWNVEAIISNPSKTNSWDKYKVLSVLTPAEYSKLELLACRLKNIFSTEFVGILWPPVQEYFDSITNNITLFADVVEWYDLRMSDKSFPEFIQMAYNIDDSVRSMIEKKILAMRGIEKCVRVIKVKFNNSNYRFKYVRPESVGGTERKSVSKSVEQLKAFVRKSYKDKIDYYFDIIMHMGDNTYQNTFMKEYFDFVRYFNKQEFVKTIRKSGVVIDDNCKGDIDLVIGETIIFVTSNVDTIIELIEDELRKYSISITYAKDFKSPSWYLKCMGYPILCIKIEVGNRFYETEN